MMLANIPRFFVPDDVDPRLRNKDFKIILGIILKDSVRF